MDGWKRIHFLLGQKANFQGLIMFVLGRVTLECWEIHLPIPGDVVGWFFWSIKQDVLPEQAQEGPHLFPTVIFPLDDLATRASGPLGWVNHEDGV